jgi:hypothetical protein
MNFKPNQIKELFINAKQFDESEEECIKSRRYFIECSDSSDDSDPIPNNRKIKNVRVTRSMADDIEILPLPDSDSELLLPSKMKRRVIQSDSEEEIKQRKSRKRESPSTDEDLIEFDYFTSSEDSCYNLSKKTLFCSVCKQNKPFDDFSTREQKQPKYGINHRFCLKHHGYHPDQYDKVLEMKAADYDEEDEEGFMKFKKEKTQEIEQLKQDFVNRYSHDVVKRRVLKISSDEESES